VALTEAIVAYVPVLHEGYRAFFARYPKAKIFVLSDELVSNFRPLIKDLRRLNPTLICRSIRAWGIDCETLRTFSFAGTGEARTPRNPLKPTGQ
jgi:hypothetical protein